MKQNPSQRLPLSQAYVELNVDVGYLLRSDLCPDEVTNPVKISGSSIGFISLKNKRLRATESFSACCC